MIGLVRKRQIKIVGRAIMPEEMGTASECFITGTAAEVTPVNEICPYKVTPGEVCRTPCRLHGGRAAGQASRRIVVRLLGRDA